MTTKARYSFEQYLNARSAYDASFSPDGNTLAFLTDITGIAQVWSVPVDTQGTGPFWPTQLTFRNDRVAGASYSPTENQLLVSGDVGGNERTQLYLLKADGSELTPLTHRPDVLYLFGGWSPDGTRISYSSNERDPRYFDVYERDIQSGEVRLLLQQDGTNYAGRYSPDGRTILVSRYESNIHNQLLLVDTGTKEVHTLTPPTAKGPSLYSSARWSADRRGLYLLSNRERQFMSLVYLELATNEITYLTDIPWDIEVLSVTRDGTRMALISNEDGYSRLQVFDVSEGWEARKAMIAPILPQGIAYWATWSHDGSRMAMTIAAPDDSMDIWTWDVEAGTVRRATRSSLGGIPQESFVVPSLIHYPTFDKREIPAFLYLPRGEQKNLPVVIDIHGGPEGQSRPILNAFRQYLVEHGYAVFVPNVRGSTGYGYEYQSLDDVRLRMDSVKDINHAVKWLQESGIADPKRIAVYGGSYGGFMVLSCITTYPDLWAAAVDVVGIANFVTFLENTGPWRRKLRESEYGSLENDREFLEQISPIHHVDQIRAPLFVVHGANDPRVPVGEAEQIVDALKKRNVPVEYMRFGDEGHGLIKRANRLIAYPAIVRFLDEHMKVGQ